LDREVMALGSSVPWQSAMEKLTGSPRMDAGPLLEYFQSLYEWLEDENVKSGAPVGWDGTGTKGEKI
jgi:peptidyl-dipeptidase A